MVCWLLWSLLGLLLSVASAWDRDWELRSFRCRFRRGLEVITDGAPSRLPEVNESVKPRKARIVWVVTSWEEGWRVGFI